MLVLHGSWLLPTQLGESGHFVLWAETSGEKPRKPRGRPSQVLPHPFAAQPERMREALRPLVSLPDGLAMACFDALLPAAGALPLPSPRLVHDWEELADAMPTGLRRFKLQGLALGATDALAVLTVLPALEELPPQLALGDDLVFWSTVARLALELLAGQRYIPAIEQVDAETFYARWRPVFDRPEDTSRLAQLLGAMPPAARALLPPQVKGEPEPAPAHRLLEDFLATVVDAAVREWHSPAWQPLRGEDVAVAWLNALFAVDPTVEGPYFTLSTLVKAHKAWVRQLHVAGDANFRVCLSLNVPDTPEEPWPLEFLLQASDDPSLLVPAKTVWKARGKNPHLPEPPLRGAPGASAHRFGFRLAGVPAPGAQPAGAATHRRPADYRRSLHLPAGGSASPEPQWLRAAGPALVEQTRRASRRPIASEKPRGPTQHDNRPPQPAKPGQL